MSQDVRDLYKIIIDNLCLYTFCTEKKTILDQSFLKIFQARRSSLRIQWAFLCKTFTEAQKLALVPEV